MPYASEAQRRFFHTDTAKKHGITAADVKEWDKASKGMRLPKRVKEAARSTLPVARGPQPPKPPKPQIVRPQQQEMPLRPTTLAEQAAASGSNKALGATDQVFGKDLTMPVTQ